MLYLQFSLMWIQTVDFTVWPLWPAPAFIIELIKPTVVEKYEEGSAYEAYAMGSVLMHHGVQQGRCTIHGSDARADATSKCLIHHVGCPWPNRSHVCLCKFTTCHSMQPCQRHEPLCNAWEQMPASRPDEVPLREFDAIQNNSSKFAQQSRHARPELSRRT